MGHGAVTKSRSEMGRSHEVNPSNSSRQIRIAIALLSIHAGLIAYGAVVHSPTYNEPAHLVAGIRYWESGEFDVYCVNPPLVRLVAAAPVLVAGCETNMDNIRKGPGVRPEMALGSDFCKENGHRTLWLITIARWACIPFSLLGGVICFCWARQLFGMTGGLLSLTLWCFSPNILAHAQLITCDVAATSLGLAASYRFWLWLRSPTWKNAVLSGVWLGVSGLAKTTTVIYYPLWPVWWIMYRWPDRGRTTRRERVRESGMLCACLVTGIYMINLGYGFEGSLTKVKDFHFVSELFTGQAEVPTSQYGQNRFADSVLANLPVPLPRNYVQGIDLQRRDFESYSSEFYLRGVWSATGWWYYYLYALAIKVPLGTWLLGLAALAARSSDFANKSLRDGFFPLAPAIVILAFVSSQIGLNEHMRYVLPVFPFVFIWLGRVATFCHTPTSPVGALIPNLAARVSVAAIVWTVTSSLMCYPHVLSYYNESVGGTKNGWQHMISSNIDWGQDLLYLRQWSVDHPDARPLKTVLFGTVISPELVGIDGTEFMLHAGDADLPSGHYAVSATFLAGFGQADHGQRLRMQLRPIVARELVGGSIFIVVKD